MVCLQPWCTKDPRPCAKYFGFLEIILSISGLIMLVCLPFFILKLDEEVIYIQARVPTSPAESNGNNPRNYTLNITNIYDDDCNEIDQSIIDFLDRYLKTLDTVSYTVSLNKSEFITSTKKFKCEIHIFTNVHPTRKELKVENQDKTKKYTIAKITAEAIHAYNKHQTLEEIEEMMSIFESTIDEISVQYIYPEKVGTDPERKACIEEHMAKAKKEDVQSDYDLMYNLLMTSGIISLVCGFLVVATEYKVSKCLLIFTLSLELLSVIPLMLAMLSVNKPSLCLLQYRGISPEGYNSQGQLATIITYTGVVYIAAYKLYCMWFLTMYARISRKLRESMMADAASTVELTGSQEKMEKAARLKSINRLSQNRDEEGLSLRSDDESPLSSDEDISLSKENEDHKMGIHDNSKKLKKRYS